MGFGFETEHARVCFQHLRVSGSSSAQAVTAQLLAALAGSQTACEGFLRIPDLKEMWKFLALIKKSTFYELDKPPHQWLPEEPPCGFEHLTLGRCRQTSGGFWL